MADVAPQSESIELDDISIGVTTAKRSRCHQRDRLMTVSVASPVGLALYGRSNRKPVGSPEAVPLIRR
eukprot:6209700-Pleurochrysis_carterae.AAC.8